MSDETFNPKDFKKPTKLTAQADPEHSFNPETLKKRIYEVAQREEDMLTAPLGPVKTWSFSRLMNFENCPYSVYLKSVENAPDPSGIAAARGTLVHDHIESYIRAEHDDLTHVTVEKGMKPVNLCPFVPMITNLREQWEAGKVEVEGNWGFKRDWEVTDFFGEDVWGRMKLDAIEFQDRTSALAIDWKGLALDTPLPTPAGWTTMAEVQEGDELFGSDGHVCRIVGKSEIHHNKCYKITFSDTTTVVADDEHLWPTQTHELITTEAMATLRAKGETIKIAVAAPIQTNYTPLPIDPYVLGLWLADGKHTSGEITKPDQEIWDRIEAHGYGLGAIGRDHIDKNKCITRTVLGLRAHLSHLELLGNKHIPARYMRASVPQRVDLLRGLMDGDGNANKCRKQAVFTTTQKQMSDQVRELIASLGQRPLQSEVTAHGFELTVQAFPISFRPLNGFEPFYLKRKMAPLRGLGDGHSKTRNVLSVEETDTVPTQCITVDSVDSTYLCTRTMAITHNTGQKFGNELKHNQQGMTYTIGAFMRYPELQFIETRFVYLDQKDAPLSNSYTRERAMLLTPMINKRANRMTTAVNFPPKPSMHACRWCPHAKTQEGYDEPLCAFRYQEL